MARATLASQYGTEADRKEEIWKSREIPCSQVIWGHWPGFTRLHLGVYFAWKELSANLLLLFFLTTDAAFDMDV